jgi:hypothetical protein
MKPADWRQQGKSGLDLIEEATHVLRTAPIQTLAIYYAGTIPFVLGVLYFWADMSRSPYADQHLAEASLGLAGLFLWMKFWQAIFACRVRVQIAGDAPPRWTLRRGWSVFVAQTIVQPSGLFLIPLSIVPALPFAWVYAFYQNVSVLGENPSVEISKLVKSSWKQATLWPRQNHVIVGILVVFGFYVFVNWTLVGWILPHLVKMLFGVDSIFTLSGFSLLNTTFFATMFGLTYLCVDPIAKVVYALRCFYGESLDSGKDLKAALRQYAGSAQQMAAGLLILLMLTAPAIAGDASPAAAAPAPQSSQPGVSPAELDRVINQVVHQRKYTWRMPREKLAKPETEKGIVGRFLEKAASLIRKWLRAVFEWLVEWLRKLFHRNGAASDSGYGWIARLELLLYALLAIAGVALVILLYRLWRNRRQQPISVASEPVQPPPDLSDENVGADQLPEDGWMRLARELIERGELRLAIRAFYLASLAQLARRNLISIARFKSNKDYERELSRRAHSLPGLLPIFCENMSVLEGIWYGMHEVSRDRVDQFAANVERMKGGV